MDELLVALDLFIVGIEPGGILDEFYFKFSCCD